MHEHGSEYFQNDFNDSLMYGVADSVRKTVVTPRHRAGTFLLDEASSVGVLSEQLEEGTCEVSFRVKYQTKYGQ